MSPNSREKIYKANQTFVSDMKPKKESKSRRTYQKFTGSNEKNKFVR